MFNEVQHAGSVKSRINGACLVAEPVVLAIEGKEIDLSLADAVALYHGLGEAIKRIMDSENALRAGDPTSNLAVLAKSSSGMGFPRSKLGDGKFIFIDGMPDTSMINRAGPASVACTPAAPGAPK